MMIIVNVKLRLDVDRVRGRCLPGSAFGLPSPAEKKRAKRAKKSRTGGKRVTEEHA